MTKRMTDERWNALFHAISIGLDQMNEPYETEWEWTDPDHPDHTLTQAYEAYMILLRRRYDQKGK